MWYYYRSWRRHSRVWSRLFCICTVAIGLAILWSLLTTFFFDGIDDADQSEPSDSPLIFCFVLSANHRHLTFARAIIYSWGKRCDRFYFVTRLQNSSVELMMLERFENITDVTPTTITQHSLNVLLHLQEEASFFPYRWFLRASDESFVILPNLRRLVDRLESKHKEQPMVHVGDVEDLYKNQQIATTGSVMLFNRQALDRIANTESSAAQDKCMTEMIYDHEFVTCLRQFDIRVNPVENNLIRSQNLSFYKMDKQLKDSCCSSDTVAFRASNETDMYKFDFLYHRLDALSRIIT